MGMIKRSLIGVVALALVSLCVQVSSALAVQPWWKLQVDSAPAILQPGQGRDEVQELTVTATGGSFILGNETNSYVSHEFAWDATHQELQEGLEDMFGRGDVEVPSGQGNVAGSDPYRIIWKDRYIERLEFGGGSLSGGATIKQVSRGRSEATLILTAANMGDRDLTGPVKLTAKLPAGMTAVQITGSGGFGNVNPIECDAETLSCTYTGITAPYEQVELVIQVSLNPGAHSGEAVELSASGGNAPPAKRTRAMTVGSVAPSFGVENYELAPEEEGGSPATQAGSHPFQLTTTVTLNGGPLENYYNSKYQPQQVEMPKDLVFKIPPGLIGNPTPFPQCTVAQFDQSNREVDECPNDTAIGVASVTIVFEAVVATFPVPLFNLTPSAGEPARFGFDVLNNPVFLDTSVRTGGDYGVTVKVTNITQQVAFVGSRVTFWGVPGDPRHDEQRGWSCLADGHEQLESAGRFAPCTAVGQRLPPPLLELPTSCTGPLQTTLEADSWQSEGSFSSVGPNTPLPSLDGCNKLPFNPSISVAPDGQAGSTPTGLTVGIHLPQEVSLDGEGLGEAVVRNTTVALPEGVVLNPSAADGLSSCSEGEAGLSEDRAVSCPDASKVGTVKIKSPLLPNALEGAVYLAAQDANPFGSLVALYVVAEDPVSGTLVKVAGEVVLNQQTGQLVSTFKNTPQLPFENFELHFFGGERAPLATPSACGAYTTNASIEPWSGNRTAEPSSTFDVISGPNGSPCSNPLPFGPSLTAGTTSIQAGGFSPFTMTMSRTDGQQNLKVVQLHMPSGLLGLVSSVDPCGEPQADAGTCTAASLIGHTTVSVGIGGDPYSVTGGEVFITGPYEGAPYGLSIVVPAVAGPYNLGKVVVRAKIEVDPLTANLTVTTDSSGPYAIPTIIDGIPLQIQHVNVTIDRPGFIFNPTDCAPLAVSGSLTSDHGAVSTLNVPFQVTNCATLGFKPKLTVATSGKTSRKNGTSLLIKIAYPKGAIGKEAWFKGAKFDFPKQLPARLTTLQKACPAATFNSNPAACPAASKVGTAIVHTSVLPGVLNGVVYFVSYGGLKFPEAVIVLQGDNVTVDLHAETFISEKTGVTSATLRSIPGVPFESVEVNLPAGPNSEFAANGNLCTAKLVMPNAFTAQNGLSIHQNTPVTTTNCPKHKTTKKVKKKPKHKKTKHK
ncbi:MAG TPA: hypothetical protein VHY18_09945 [Solirubrobacteraceae bacterium]|nr:hypothetical protein [Solirubrobacteraceae bacterium]